MCTSHIGGIKTDVFKNNCKVQAIQTSSKTFLSFFTSFDRILAADHEYLLFSLSESFFPVEKYEILARCRFSRKMHPFLKYANFSTLSDVFDFKNIVF
jgi:hypothetical protein